MFFITILNVLLVFGKENSLNFFVRYKKSLLAFLALSLFPLLFGRERIFHQEMTVGRILLGCKVGLDLFWQHDGSFECLHMRYIHVGLVFFLPFGMWPSQVVSYRGDLLKLLHASAISAILRYFLKFV